MTVEAYEALRTGLLDSPLAEELTVEIGARRETIRGAFLEPTEPVSFGSAQIRRLDPQIRVSHAELIETGAGNGDFVIRGATVYDPGTRYTIVDVAPPDVAGLSRVTIRKYAQP